MKKRIQLLLLILMGLNACSKIDLKTADKNVPVVECYMSPDEEIVVRIVKQLVYNSTDTSTSFLDNLNVYISDKNMSYTCTSSGQGMYTNSEIEIVPLMEYHINFFYNNKMISAQTIVPEKPLDFSASATTIEVFSFDDFTPGSGTPPEKLDPIILSWSNSNSDYHMIVVECIETNPSLITESTSHPPRLFRNMPTVGNSQELNPMSFSYFGKHQLILYKLNAEYAALYEQLGTNSLDITAPPSNIINGLGIFTGINADTLYLNVRAQ